MNNNNKNIEIVAESLASVIQARDGNADRVELVSSLLLGGLTPSPGLIVAADNALKQSNTKLHIMIRPRERNFCYSEDEFFVMKQTILYLKDVIHKSTSNNNTIIIVNQINNNNNTSTIKGIVFGILKPDGSLDKERCKELIELAKPELISICHRCVDMSCDPLQAMKDAKEIGYRLILTSGGAVDAMTGIELLKEAVRVVDNNTNVDIYTNENSFVVVDDDDDDDGCIDDNNKNNTNNYCNIMIGGGVSTSNIKQLKSITKAIHYHGSLRDSQRDVDETIFKKKELYMTSELKNKSEYSEYLPRRVTNSKNILEIRKLLNNNNNDNDD